MDISSFAAINGLSGVTNNSQVSSLNSLLNVPDIKGTDKTTDGTMFGTFFNTAVENIKTTNSYLSDAENEEMLFALGETDNTHDLTVALQKASTALQYTVAIRDKVLEAYKELMQIQI